MCKRAAECMHPLAPPAVARERPHHNLVRALLEQNAAVLLAGAGSLEQAADRKAARLLPRSLTCHRAGGCRGWWAWCGSRAFAQPAAVPPNPPSL